MSVINQMLKDLEQRRAQGFDSDEGMLDDLDSASSDATPNKKTTNVWMVLTVFLLIAIIATWLYLDGNFQSDSSVAVKQTTEKTPKKIIRPAVIVHKSVVKEIAIEGKKVSEPLVVAKEPVTAAIEKTMDVMQEKQELPMVKNVAVKEPVAPVSELKINISSITPSPLLATGSREIITVKGSGFVAPLSVTVEWDAGRAFNVLEPWQVKVNSETEIQLHINLGKDEDQWRLLIKSLDGTQQAEYEFAVAAMIKPTSIPKQSAVEIEPEADTSFTKTNRVLSEEEQIAQLLSKTGVFMQEGKTRQAKETLRQILALDFSHLEARQTLSTILFREQAYDDAIEVLELGNIQHPTHVPFVSILARIYAERGQDGLAVDMLERLEPSVASNSEYYALLAALYQRGAQYSNAVAIYKKLLLSFPSKAVWWMGLGLSLQSLQQTQEALGAYNKSLQTIGLSAELRRFVNTRITQLKG